MTALWALGSLCATDAKALIFASPDSEPEESIPADFPYWDHVTQRRYDGPSVIYLGAGWALTARHVGVGEIILQGHVFAAEHTTRHALLNESGGAADAVVFRVVGNSGMPDLPLLPIAQEPPEAGEEVILIGFGRERKKVIEWLHEGQSRFGFEWTDQGAKRWGTNRIRSNHEILDQPKWSTRALSFVFDPPNSLATTAHEAQAAVGDSGGAVFVKRDGEWLLAGMMISISVEASVPDGTTTYGATTFAVDMAFYRSEIMRWARPICANERDDDEDRKTDFPLDPGCTSPTDSDERDTHPLSNGTFWAGGFVSSCVLGLGLWSRFRTRE